MRDLSLLTWIGVGGALGAVLRYAVSCWLNQHSAEFPWGTLVVNLTGCFLLGLLAYAVDGGYPVLSPTLRVVVSAGFLGGLTTFSTFGLETFDRISRGMWTMALLNVGANVVMGLVAVGLGRFVAQAIFTGNGITG